MAENPDRINVTVDLNTSAARHELAELMRAISTFAGSVTEDLNQLAEMTKHVANELDNSAADRGDPDAQS